MEAGWGSLIVRRQVVLWCHHHATCLSLSPCTCDRVCTMVLAQKLSISNRYRRIGLSTSLWCAYPSSWGELPRLIDGCGRGMRLMVTIVIDNASICMSTTSKCITVCSSFLISRTPYIIVTIVLYKRRQGGSPLPRNTTPPPPGLREVKLRIPSIKFKGCGYNLYPYVNLLQHSSWHAQHHIKRSLFLKQDSIALFFFLGALWLWFWLVPLPGCVMGIKNLSKKMKSICQDLTLALLLEQ